MKIKEIIVDPHNAELDRIKAQEKAVKVRKASVKAQQAQQQLSRAKAPTKPQ